MSKKSNDSIIFHVSAEKLNEHIRELEKVAKKVNRLHFIQQLYKGLSVQEACSILNIPIRTGFDWRKKWNAEGINGLDHRKGAGRPPFLSETEFEEVNQYISSNNNLGTKDVHKFIEDNFGIDYSLKQVREIIHKLEYSWIKPYPIYSKSPETAKEDLKKKLQK